MDCFVKRFYPDGSAPGVPYTYGSRMDTATFLKAGLQVNFGDQTQNKFFTSRQSMTYAGKMRAFFGSTASSLDGMTRQYLTPEGSMNLTALGEDLKNSAGLQWNWADNHTSLIVNLLRFCLLQKIQEEGGDLQGSLGVFTDGEMEIDMDRLFPADYPAPSVEVDKSRFAWPGGADEDNYPIFEYLSDSVPKDATTAVDLRGLSCAQAKTILLLMGAWRRSSRARLDFSLPMLADTVYYRAEQEIADINDWMKVGKNTDRARRRKRSQTEAAPEVPNSASAWAALRGYVTQNRIFHHFSTALYIVSAVMYQFLPSTAEATAWLDIDWCISLPAFRSIQGRYCCLNEGEAALVSRRALNEWNYVVGDFENLNLMALCFAQAYQTGLAVRSVRRGLEERPDDLMLSEAEFYTTTNFLSAAATEAVRGPVPLSGMSGVYVYASVNFDQLDEDRSVPTLNYAKFMVPRMTFAGFPTLIVPLSCFPYTTPFDLKGAVDAKDVQLSRIGLKVWAKDMWGIYNLASLCGYHPEVKYSCDMVGAKEYKRPDDVHFTWPILLQEPDIQDRVLIKQMGDHDRKGITLPSLCSHFFSGHRVEYNVKVMAQGVAKPNLGQGFN